MLRLNDNGISTLDKDAFADLTTLTQLELTDNELESLDATVFDDLTQLTGLRLQNNRLTTLPPGIFTNNTGLTLLNLSGNDLSSLPATVFSKQAGLILLFLNDNKLTGLPSNIFSGLNYMGSSSLERLILHDNSLTLLHQDIFDGLDKVYEITLQNNSLTALHVDVFEDTVSLSQLDLRDNNISSLPDTVFDSTPDLSQLYLGGNSISSFSGSLFTGLMNLKILDLSRNGFTTLPLAFLSNYPLADTLVYLDLSGNGFTGEPTKAAIKTTFTAIEEYYIMQDSPTGIIDDITISGGDREYYVPQRNSNHEIRYKATAPFGADSLTINVAPRDSGATIVRHDEAVGAFRIISSANISSDDDGYLLNDRDPNTPGIQIGAPLSHRNVVEFFVDGNHYIIDVYRDAPSSNARLESLELDQVTLKPAFDSHTLEYVGFADLQAQMIQVRVSKQNPGATVVTKLNGTTMPNDQYVINDAVTEVITVEVTAEDGVTTRTYRVELLPKVTLQLSSNSREERDRGPVSVLAFLNKPVAQDTTVKISIHGSRRANLSSAKTVVIRADKTYRDSTLPPVEISTVDNEHFLDYQLRVSGTVIDNPDVYNPDDVFLTIIDDDLPVPNVPANFVVTSEAGKTTFDWDNVTKPRHAHRVRYEIFVRAPGGSYDDWVFLTHTGSRELPPADPENPPNPPLKTPDEGPVTRQRLPVGGTYEFALRALVTTRSPAGNTGSALPGELTAPVTHTVQGPNRPLDLEAERTVDGVGGPVKLTWQSPPLYPIHADLPALMPVPNPNRDATATLYTIYRAEEPADDEDPLTGPDHGAIYSEVGSVAGNVLTYTDADATDDKAYFYRVQATSPDGPSDLSGHGFVYPKPSEARGFGAGSPTYGMRTTDSEGSLGLSKSGFEYRKPRSNDRDSVLLQGRDGSAPALAEAVVTASYVVYRRSTDETWSVQIDISASGPNSDPAVGYVVHRQLRDADPPEEPALVARLGAGISRVTDTGLEAGAAYAYSITAIFDGGQSGSTTVDVDIPGGDTVPRVTGPITGFTLVDASDQTVLATISDGGSVELADPSGGSYAIRADVDPNVTIGSVRLALSGAKTVSRTENVAPYSLYGDGGANALSGESLPVGSYTLTATAYSDSDLGGDELGTLEVSFTVTAPSETNNAPQFGSTTYNFSVAEDASTAAAVGTVSATDADNHSITYTIEAGNGDGVFAIGGSSGAITTAGALDHENTPSYTLTVQADDGNGGTDTATVNITVTDVVEDPDATREGAVSLGDQSPAKGRQFFYNRSLDKANGDGVDYYTFTTDGRYVLGLGARDQSIELKVTLEDADGNVVGVAGPPLDKDKDQVYIEWLKVTIDAGTYYIKVEALEDDATDYYIRFGLETP